jgi:hypothetical protein
MFYLFEWCGGVLRSGGKAVNPLIINPRASGTPV